MTTGLPLFDAPYVRNSPTSQAAAESVTPAIGRLRQVVLDHIRSCGERGCTDEELIDAVGLGPNTPRPRRIECVRMGLVKDTGTTRPTKSGRAAVVWKATI